MTMSNTNPLTGIVPHFRRARHPYGADLSNVIEHIAFRVEREGRVAANEFEPIIFPVTERRA